MLYSCEHTKALLYSAQALIDDVSKQDNQAMIDNKKKPAEKLAEQITALIDASEKTSATIAAECGVSPQAVNGWKRTGRISKDMLPKLASSLGVHMSAFFPGTNEWGRRARQVFQEVEEVENPEAAPKRRALDLAPQNAQQILIPHYPDIGGSMGGGLLLRDQPGEIQGWRVTTEWISKNVKSHTGAGNLRVVTGFGDSMRPLYNPGDPLLVDAGVKTVEFDSIYFFRIGDEGFIKRLQRVPGQGLLAISENKSYRDWVITPEMDFEVFARVIKVWCGSDF